MADEPPRTAGRLLAPVIEGVLSIAWGGTPDELMQAWPSVQVARDTEDVQTLIVPQITLGAAVDVRAECTFTWEGLISVVLTPLGPADAAFAAVCAHLLRSADGPPRQVDLGYSTHTYGGARIAIDRLDRKVRLEEAP
jgi:hypothetical protein